MSITVFLIDDYAAIREGLRSLLEAQREIEVVGDAPGGRGAVDQVAQLQPDVVIMDISMPEMDGIEATRQIRESCPSAQVIIFSIHSTPEHIFRALQAGARGYLLKESAGVEVVRAVLAVQDGHCYLSPKLSDRVIDDYVRRRSDAEAKSSLARLGARTCGVLQRVIEDRPSSESRVSLSSLPVLS